MAQSVYSFYGSRLHLVLEDSVADAYNRAVDAFYQGQRHHHEYHEKEWDPKEKLAILVDPADVKVFNDIGRVINLLGEINGGGLDIPEDELTSDYLVRVD